MIAIISQARLNSSRLPGKILKKISGTSLLDRFLDRILRAKTVDKIIIATTQNKEDKKIIAFAKRRRLDYFSGSEKDVLDRYYQAAKKFGVDTIVRVTTDNPLMDPRLIDTLVNYYKKHRRQFDYVSNVQPPTFPDGMDIEVFSFAALKQAWQEARLPSEREHVTAYIVNHRELFRLGNVESKQDFSHLRLTVDEPEDLKLIRNIFSILCSKNKNFGLNDILKLYKARPGLFSGNAHIQRNEGYSESLKRDLPK